MAGCNDLSVQELQYAPTAEILSPVDGGTAPADEVISFNVTAQDDDDPPESIVVTVRTDQQNEPLWVGSLPDNRIVPFETLLSEGGTSSRPSQSTPRGSAARRHCRSRSRRRTIPRS